MKILYSFTENQEQEIDEVEESINEKGEKVSVTKKVKKQVPFKFGLRMPTRSLTDDAQLYYSIKFGEAVKLGLINNALIDKRINTDGGVFTKEENKEFDDKIKEFGQVRAEYEKLVLEKSEDKEKIKSLEGTLMSLRKRIQELDVKKVSVYDNSAETYARNKTTVWWFLNLAIKEPAESKPELIFKGKELNDKFEEWDKTEESEDSFMKKVLNKLLLITSFYHRGLASTPAEFDLLIKLADDNLSG